MPFSLNLQSIAIKVEAGEKLSLEEEINYFVEILSDSKDEAERLLYIVDNRVAGVFVD